MINNYESELGERSGSLIIDHFLINARTESALALS